MYGVRRGQSRSVYIVPYFALKTLIHSFAFQVTIRITELQLLEWLLCFV